MIPNATRELSSGLGETADAIRDSVSGFAQDKNAPRAGEIDRTDAFPRDLWPAMGAPGLHGTTVEEDDGGLGGAHLDHRLASEEVSWASALVGLSCGAHSNLPDAGSGSDVVSMRARADRRGGRYEVGAVTHGLRLMLIGRERSARTSP